MVGPGEGSTVGTVDDIDEGLLEGFDVGLGDFFSVRIEINSGEGVKDECAAFGKGSTAGPERGPTPGVEEGCMVRLGNFS